MMSHETRAERLDALLVRCRVLAEAADLRPSPCAERVRLWKRWAAVGRELGLELSKEWSFSDDATAAP